LIICPFFAIGGKYVEEIFYLTAEIINKPVRINLIFQAVFFGADRRE